MHNLVSYPWVDPLGINIQIKYNLFEPDHSCKTMDTDLDTARYCISHHTATI